MSSKAFCKCNPEATIEDRKAAQRVNIQLVRIHSYSIDYSRSLLMGNKSLIQRFS
jgi:hypothetical protein